jgi:type II secretory pathway pseudopilin PulG
MQKSVGFTIIELVVIITVLAILAGITMVSYGAWQRQIAADAITSDLQQAQSAMKNKLNFDNQYPANLEELSEAFIPSTNTSLVLVTSADGGLPTYSNLSTVQNGVLFYQICGDLVSEGYGKGTNNGGQEEQYISACNVYNDDQLQVNSAWTGRNLNTPVASTALPAVVSGINYNDSWRPDRDQIEKDFYQTWHERFQNQGGNYPITSFWDPWCTGACVWGTQLSPLPTHSGSTAVETDYCIQASSQRYGDINKHVVTGSGVLDGPC